MNHFIPSSLSKCLKFLNPFKPKEISTNPKNQEILLMILSNLDKIEKVTKECDYDDYIYSYHFYINKSKIIIFQNPYRASVDGLFLISVNVDDFMKLVSFVKNKYTNDRYNKIKENLTSKDVNLSDIKNLDI